MIKASGGKLTGIALTADKADSRRRKVTCG
ncbi:unknown [Prevotella sp. CAG:1185]|nr:unknown [Prevotella sp. CAG:1185]